MGENRDSAGAVGGVAGGLVAVGTPYAAAALVEL
jgi:hypothetical protein